MSEQLIFTIRTLQCDICDRYDTIMLAEEEVQIRVNVTDIGIGAYAINHNDHVRIVYFDEKGSYLGDTIAYDQYNQVQKKSWLAKLTSAFKQKMKLTKT